MVEALITNFSAFILVNPEFCRFKGMKAEEFLGKTPREVAVNLSQVGAANNSQFPLASGSFVAKVVLQFHPPTAAVFSFQPERQFNA